MTANIILLTDALLCQNCGFLVSAREVRGEQCTVCSAVGCLFPIARILNPTPELGSITYMRVGLDYDS